MICILCKGKVAKRVVQEDITVGNDHIMVNLEAEVCENCHERYYPEGTVDYLQKLKQDLKSHREQFTPVGQVYQAV
ncbi:MAG: YgiT-type zinc finger protein [Deltaproteobacteria bacterium]|nr:YgiT-type zinc finger protein [Deltaproteobacteria bacterium]